MKKGVKRLPGCSSESNKTYKPPRIGKPWPPNQIALAWSNLEDSVMVSVDDGYSAFSGVWVTLSLHYIYRSLMRK